MKIKLLVDENLRSQLEKLFSSCGIEIDEDAELVLQQRNKYAETIRLKDENGQKLHLPVEDIVFIESFGHNIQVKTEQKSFSCFESLKSLSLLLDPSQFLRVSNCVIINRRHVKKITPSFSMKFRLEMSNGEMVDVTRTYYNNFREFFKI